ncbi:hypothetical protein [Lutibacter sp.]|uniref:hypothetical protein n=1 Tax=Lutibacter sp. TaxID=1925666 RepID=UPI0025BC956F|nr:hypothetical protein [Lutibacter sp.]MCF6182812.1 hypothetical protein [Lutibacter sp.]
MNSKELEIKLDELKVPKRYYSLKKGLLPDRFYLVTVEDSYWEFYYFDERGGKNNYKKFLSEENACNYFYSKMIEMKYAWSAYN